MSEKPILRELSVGELLDKAFRLYRAKFLPLIGIAAVIYIPATLLQILSLVYWGDTRLVDLFQNAILSNITTTTLIVFVAGTYLATPVSIRQAYKLGLDRFPAVLGAQILMGLAILVPAVIMGILVAILRELGLILLLLLGLPLLIYLSTRWSIATPIIVLEKARAMDGLYRSWSLTRDDFWRVLGTSMAANLLVLLVGIFPTLFVTFLADWLSIPTMQVELVTAILSQFILVIVSPFSVAVTALIYYDLRIRVEAFDIAFAVEEPIKPLDEPKSA